MSQPDSSNAQSVLACLHEDPRRHDVDHIADVTGLSKSEVRAALDEWRPNTEGNVTYIGPGQGGPWVSIEDDVYSLLEHEDE